MKTLTQPVTARNLTAWFVSVPPGQEIPDYTVLEEAMEKQAGLPRDIAEVSAWIDESTTAAPEVENLPPRTHLSTRRAKSQLRFENRDTAFVEPIHLSILAQ